MLEKHSCFLIDVALAFGGTLCPIMMFKSLKKLQHHASIEFIHRHLLIFNIKHYLYNSGDDLDFRRALEMYLSVSVIVCLLSTCHGFAVSSDNGAEFNVQEDDINDRGKVIM